MKNENLQNPEKYVRRIEFWLAKGMSLEEATQKLIEAQNAGAHKRGKRIKSQFSIGDKFGFWKIEDLDIRRGEEIGRRFDGWFVKVVCKCGKEAYREHSKLTKGISTGCQSCSINRRLNKNVRWSGYKSMSGSIVKRIKHGAEQRNIPFNITKEFMYDLMIEQKWKCSLTGIILNWKSASLDRIDSLIGYEEGNVQWVHKRINVMKNAMSKSELLYWCNAVLSYGDNHNNVPNVCPESMSGVAIGKLRKGDI
jgi:hypothetical protein